jgi:translation initiation factor RLI1
MRTVEEYREKLNKAKGQKALIKSELSSSKTVLNISLKRLELIEKARAYIQLKAQETQNKISIRIEDIVQMAIDTCFAEDDYCFELKFKPQRNRTEANLRLLKDGWETDSTGEGLVDLEAFGLRIGTWTLERTDNVIVLDEPFKFLDEKRKPLAGEILKELSKTLDLQIIVATHDRGIIDVADRIIEVSIHKGISKISIT